MPFSYVPSNFLRSSVAFIAAIATAGPLLGIGWLDTGALLGFRFWYSLRSARLLSFDALVRVVFEGRMWVSVLYIL